MQPPPKSRIIRIPEVMKKTGLSRATIYAWMADGKFPAGMRIGLRMRGWTEAEIDEWIISHSKGGE